MGIVLWAIVLWIFAMSSRTVTPLEIQLLPYRWHYPTPIFFAPSARDIAVAPPVAHDAPSGREAELKDKDKYGEDYILEEIEFSNVDIGKTGKLDYYIDEGIEYYDVDIFAASYSGEKTQPKVRLNFGSNAESGRRIDNIEVDVLNGPRFQVFNQDGRHFNSHVGSPDYHTPPHQNAGSRIQDLERYSGRDNHFSGHGGSADYHIAHQNTDRTISDFVGFPRQNNQDGGGRRAYNTHSHIPDKTSGIRFHDIESGRYFNHNDGTPEYQTNYQSTDKPQSDSGIHYQSNHNAGNVEQNSGMHEIKTNYQSTDKTQSDSGSHYQSNHDAGNADQNSDRHEIKTNYQSTGKTHSDSGINYRTNQDNRHFNPNVGIHHNQASHSNLGSSIDATRQGVNGGHFLRKLSRQGQNLRAMVMNKDEIMDAVE